MGGILVYFTNVILHKRGPTRITFQNLEVRGSFALLFLLEGLVLRFFVYKVEFLLWFGQHEWLPACGRAPGQLSLQIDCCDPLNPLTALPILKNQILLNIVSEITLFAMSITFNSKLLLLKSELGSVSVTLLVQIVRYLTGSSRVLLGRI